MKAKTRMIVASAVVIAFALTAVSGVTYSWFSDTEQAEIDITAGKVDFGLNIASFTDKTVSGAATQAVSDGITYDFGLSAKVSYNGAEKNTAKISMKSLADRDSLKIDFKITNNSTIKTIYRVSASPSGTLTQYLQNEFTVGGETYSDCTGWLPASVPTTVTSDIEGSLVITMNSGGKANNIDDDKAATIILKVEAYQANTESSDLPAYHVVQTVAANETISKTFTNTETTVVDSTGVEFEASTGGDYTIGSITAAVDGSYTIAQTAGDDQKEKTVITGISVNATKDSADVDLKDQTAIIRFVLNESALNGDKTALKDGYSIYHQSGGAVTALTLSKVNASPSSEGQYTLEKIGETSYAMNVYVKGFSAYYLVIDANAIVDGEYVKMTTEKDETNVETILNKASKAILLDDLSYEEDTDSWQLTSDLVLDLNGHTISFNGSTTLAFSGNLKVIGTATGSGMSSNQSPLFYFYGENASLTIDGGTYKSTEGSVIWGQGEYEGKKYCEGAEVTIISGTFTGKENVIYLAEGNLTINGGSFTSSGDTGCEVDVCIGVLGGSLTINGGVFQTTNVNIIQHMSGDSSDTGKLTINGGSFNATFSKSSEFMLDLYKGTTEINGGKFNLKAESYGAVINLGTNAQASILGGTFNLEVSGTQTGANFIVPSSTFYALTESYYELNDSAKIVKGGIFNFDPSSIAYNYYSEWTAEWSFVNSDFKVTDNGDGTYSVKKSDLSEQ